MQLIFIIRPGVLPLIHCTEGRATTEMTMLTNSWKIGTRVNACDDPKLQVKLRRPQPGKLLQLQPATPEEPLYRNFSCNTINVKQGKARHFATSGDVVVTAKRMLILLRGRSTAKGAAENLTVVSVDRGELRELAAKKNRHDKILALEISTSNGDESISISAISKTLESLKEMLDPKSAERLGPEAAAAREKAIREAEEKRLEAERRASEEKVKAAAAKFGAEPDSTHRASPVSLTSGGLLDHQKTWHYRVAASEAQCIQAFADAFSSGGGVILRAKWDVRKAPNGATAAYRGRKGIMGVATSLSDMASAEQAGAVDSEVKFEILGRDGDHTLCVMWLASHGSRLGFTNDARFFKPYMRTVETELRRLDPSTQVVKE
jgi:hypothetical protein